MPANRRQEDEESQPLTDDSAILESTFSSPGAHSSSSSTSTTSFVLEHLGSNGYADQKKEGAYKDDDDDDDDDDPNEHTKLFEELDYEEATLRPSQGFDKKYKRWLIIIGTLCAIGWAVAFVLLIWTESYKPRSALPHDAEATASLGTGKKITIEQLQSGMWIPRMQAISWIESPSGEDGLLLEMGGDAYLAVEDIRRGSEQDSEAAEKLVLMEEDMFVVGTELVHPGGAWPSPDLKNVLVVSDRVHNWRHSFFGRYWVFNVETQTAQPLDPTNSSGRVQLATWSPNSDAVVFTRDNNMFLRRLDGSVTPVTTNGGPEMFNGVPDWVYEEEVFSGNSATWWSRDGRFIAFLATNESMVPSYPVQYFLSRPSGVMPEPGLEHYPEVRKIKYPKAGAPNPVVHLRFYDVERGEVFDVPIADDFPDDDRLITEVIWGGNEQVLIRQTNRESYILKMVLIDAKSRTGRIVRTQDVNALDGGWFEITETTTFVPADPSNGREYDGYIDTVIHEGYDHLAYFTPLDNPEPKLLTSGKWEVENAPSAVDLKNNYVYFQSTRDGATSRHVYKVSLNGTGMSALTDTSKNAYYSASFSSGAGYALLTYRGPNIPTQKVISTPSNPSTYSKVIEKNEGLAELASSHELPLIVYSTVNIQGFDLNVKEYRPPHFDARKQYPVLFYTYGGPGSQYVDKSFSVSFQSYVAANLGYVVVIVDGRGTGMMGRKTRCIVSGNLGYYEAYDQIATARIWAGKSYVDSNRMAIWGWSYGGYLTLKTLEMDEGRTFKYGMAVAPVTDWRFYDTIYTERWMHTPQHNPQGYHNSSIHNMTALGESVRFLLMHGVSDDNVHFQNSLTLLDNLDRESIENYDVHVFPDSDHSIYFHNANRIIYDKLSWWLINAFNGEWERLREVHPFKPGSAGLPGGGRRSRWGTW